MKTGIATTIIMLVCVFPQWGEAKVRSESLLSLVAEAEWIVVAKVVKIERAIPFIGSPKYATIQVVETWKGQVTNSLRVSVKRTWVCDISTAEKGEMAVFFLVTDGKTRETRLIQAGRGRLPVREVEGKKYATFWPEVIMPKKLEVNPGLEPKCEFIRSVRLDMLKAEVLRILDERIK